MDRPKKGFGVPIHAWFKDELKDYLMYYLDHERIVQAGVFDAKKGSCSCEISFLTDSKHALIRFGIC